MSALRLAIVLAALAVTARPSPTLAQACAVGAPGCCSADPDCDDGNPCNGNETCDVASGTCQAGQTADGVPCNDLDACTQTDTCEGGTCMGSNPVVCTASDQCHDAGTCDPATGTCSNPARSDGSGCDDGDACTQTDTCHGGTCVGASPVVCTASDQCHKAGTCDPGTGTCSNPTRPDGTPCDDGDGCTVGDRCLAGVCAGVARSCDDGVACTADSCVGGECQHEPLDVRCDTGECFLAQCMPGSAGADAAGCTRTPVGEGDTCTSDGFACTDDVCMAGACHHTPMDLHCATGEACLLAVCNPTTSGADSAGCVAVAARADGTECAEDGDPCTDDSCLAGACLHTPVANKPACDPVRPLYSLALVLAADARALSALVAGALPAAARSPSGAPSDSLAGNVGDVASTLERVARILAGKEDGPTGSAGAPGLQNIAGDRAQAALQQLKQTPAEEQRVVRAIATAQHRTPLPADTARSMRLLGRRLLSGTKALKRGLKRLKKVSQSFTR